jgi:choloylglycine hydrolase
VADRQGNAAAVEYLDGKPVVHTGESLPAPVLTNHPYERSLRYLERHEGAGELPSTRDSLDRFVRAAVGARAAADGAAEAAPASDRAFDLLARVSQGQATKWSIVYEPAAARIRFRTWQNERTRELSLEQLDFDCNAPVRALDLAAEVAGNVARHLSDWTPGDNAALVKGSYRNTPMFRGTPAEAVQRVAAYPGTSSCVGLDLETSKSTTSGR